MSDPGKQDRVEELLRKSLFGEELVQMQFHLFSARGSSSGRILKPRVLCANDALLAKSSTYFTELFSADVSPSDPSLVDLADDRDVPGDETIEEYGYASDSDLDECEDAAPASIPEASKDRSPENADDSDDESVSSDMFVMSPEHPREELPFSAVKDGTGSVASSETAVHGTATVKPQASSHQAGIHLRSWGSRHVLVKDTAFQTWYTLFYYLYTDKINFLPLSSATPGGQPRASATSPADEPGCSAKSMYRLASKIGLDHLRDEALSHIKRDLTEHNIVRELSSSLVSKHPALLEMALDVLYDHIASPHVVAEFPGLARRIANGELPHGADVVVGIHARLLRVFRPSPLEPAAPVSLGGSSAVPEPEPARTVFGQYQIAFGSRDKAEGETGLPSTSGFGLPLVRGSGMDLRIASPPSTSDSSAPHTDVTLRPSTFQHPRKGYPRGKD